VVRFPDTVTMVFDTPSSFVAGRLNRLRERQNRLDEFWGSDGEEEEQETHDSDQ